MKKEKQLARLIIIFGIIVMLVGIGILGLYISNLLLEIYYGIEVCRSAGYDGIQFLGRYTLDYKCSNIIK